MTQVETIAGELQALRAGAERAQGLAAAADNQAQEIALRAAAAGFTAVAAGMARVRAAIGELRGRLGGLLTTIDEASTATSAVPREATPQDTIAALTPVHQGIVGAREASAATSTHVGTLQRLVTTVLHGGQPGPMLQTLDGIKQVLALMAQRAGTAEQTVEAAIAAARRLGSAGN
ncbi:DUF6244 family protein [Micromonospora krabiensis]|uniref:DUF6244 family protein n=1 Tax=Micromonospora krabiensis TaxID=307121 RepID=UPI000B84B430|nr:DUF6244 family protein [Micromonospora krabiensis]